MLTELEKARLANIERNRATLERLGLDNARKQFNSTSRAAGKKRSRAASTRRIEGEPAQKVRSSARLAKIPAPPILDIDEIDVIDEMDDETRLRRQRIAQRRREQQKKRSAAGLNSRTSSQVPSSKGGKQSTKFVKCRRFSSDDELLGKPVEPPYKWAVMEMLALSPVRFSKMSGIQAFADSIVLFVNVDGTTYNNMFSIDSDQYVSMTWFAQPSQHEESPVIVRMRANKEPILLFCRQQPLAYVFCGHLSLLEFDSSVRPMRAKWRLSDVRRGGSVHKKLREHFPMVPK